MSATRTAKRPAKKPVGAKRDPKSKKSRQANTQRPAVQEAHNCGDCGRPYKTERGLANHQADKHPPRAEAAHVPPKIESTVEAVERALTNIDDSPRRAVLVSTVRRLADALDRAHPTDRPKISKELTARMSELMAEAKPSDDDGDWTKGDDPPTVGDATKPGS